MSGKLAIGTTDPIDIRLGSTKVKAMYLGTTQVWPMTGMVITEIVVGKISAGGGSISSCTVYYTINDSEEKDKVVSFSAVSANDLLDNIRTTETLIKTVEITVTDGGFSQQAQVNIYQEKNLATYESITLTLSAPTFAPASGGYSGVPGFSYEQMVRYSSGYNDKLTDGATVYFGKSSNPTSRLESACQFYGEDLLTDLTPQTRLGNAYVKVAMNGKTAEKSIAVYQQENKVEGKPVERVTNWTLSLTNLGGNPFTGDVPAAGGQTNAYVRCESTKTITSTYTSTHTSVVTENGPAVPIWSYSGCVKEVEAALQNGDFYLGHRVVAKSSTESSRRSGTITATYNGSQKSVTLWQEAYVPPVVEAATYFKPMFVFSGSVEGSTVKANGIYLQRTNKSVTGSKTISYTLVYDDMTVSSGSSSRKTATGTITVTSSQVEGKYYLRASSVIMSGHTASVVEYTES